MFTYDPATDIGRIRFHLGDNILKQGVLPNGDNFEDEELTQLMADSRNDIGLSLVRLARTLMARWTNAPKSFIADGLRVNRGDPAKHWKEMIDIFDKDFQVSVRFTGGGMFTFSLVREDQDDV